MFVKLAPAVFRGQFERTQQQTEELSTTERQSFTADLDQVSSSGLRPSFPDKIVCCGDNSLNVSVDAHVALSGYTYLFFFIFRQIEFLCSSELKMNLSRHNIYL